MRLIFKFFVIIFMLFLVPTIAAAGWWASVERPVSWRNADWGATGLLAGADKPDDAAIYVMAARTGGFKGAFAVHSWILIKRPGQIGYDRYDKMGWGSPIRKNTHPADANWYSNPPHVVGRVSGDKALSLIDDVEAAIAQYPYSDRGDYTLWPGPNSNTFVASVLRAVPELNISLPPNAVGRDYLGAKTFIVRESDGSDTHFSILGLIGFSFGQTTGVELHFLGQSIGFDFSRPAIKLPAFGRIELVSS